MHLCCRRYSGCDRGATILLAIEAMSDTQQSMLKDNTKLIITLGFGAVLTIMFVLVFIAITQLQALNTRMFSLVDDSYAKMEAANAMRDAIRLRASALTAMQLSDD